MTVEPVAVGREGGSANLMINPSNPTVSTASQEFVGAAHNAPGWESQRWTKTIRVPVTTLDALIAKHVELAINQSPDHPADARCVICGVSVYEHIDVGIYIGKHSPDHKTLAAMLFLEHLGTRRTGDFSGFVR